jgi:hypothetical protein
LIVPVPCNRLIFPNLTAFEKSRAQSFPGTQTFILGVNSVLIAEMKKKQPERFPQDHRSERGVKKVVSLSISFTGSFYAIQEGPKGAYSRQLMASNSWRR